MSASLYENTDFLLPHDDEIADRKITYLYYLSDLTKTIKFDGKEFIPSKMLFGENLGNPEKYIGAMGYNHIAEWLRKPETWKVYQWYQVIEWGFDVFGLIEKGLAVDINTLKNGKI